MSAITGRAKKYDGTPIDYVSIFNWDDGKCIAQVTPNAAGDWSYTYTNSLKVGITYVADGCEPITHGAYDFVLPWTPLKIQPKLYLDTDSAVWSGGVGSNINAWADISGEQSDFLRYGSVIKTADGALSIPAGDNYIYNSSSKAKAILSGVGKAWIFMVVNLKADSSTLLHIADTSERAFTPRLTVQYVGGKFRKNSSRNTFLDDSLFFSGDVPKDTYHMVLLEHDWSTGRVAWYVNGALDTFDDNQITDKGITNSAIANNSVFIGQYPTSGNSLSQEQKMIVVITDKELTQIDIDKLFGYAAHKHGLTAKLPTNHPYKDNSP